MKSTSNKMSFSTLDVVLLCATFYEITAFPHLIYIIFKYIVLVYLLLKYILECKRIKQILGFIALYGATTFLSTIVNGLAANTMVAALMYALQIVDIFVVTSRYVRRKGTDSLLRIVFKVFLVYLLITDALMLVAHYDFANPEEEYFVGNKFIVSYLHCFELCILCYFERKHTGKKKSALKRTDLVWLKRWLLPCLASLYSIIICSTGSCSTGIVICALFTVLILMPIPDRIKRLLSDSKPIIIVTVVFNILIFGTFGLLTNQYVAAFIRDVMGKSYTWIGRLRIYEVVFGIFMKNPLIGSGYYNNAISSAVSFAGNVQNGIIKIAVDSGIIGLLGYSGMIYKGLKASKKANEKLLWPFYAFVYVMIAASLVEINMTHMIVFFVVALVYMNHKTASR